MERWEREGTERLVPHGQAGTAAISRLDLGKDGEPKISHPKSLLSTTTLTTSRQHREKGSCCFSVVVHGFLSAVRAVCAQKYLL